MGHGQSDPYGDDHEATFHAAVNAVLDFRYSASSRLHWWCDHHQSTFLNPAQRTHYETHPDPRKHFDPAAPSCAGLLSRWLSRQHGFNAEPFADHIHWADLIDSARFDNPRQAVELTEPALQLMILLESKPAKSLIDGMLTGLSEQSIEEVHHNPALQAALVPVFEQHQQMIELFRQRIQIAKGVAYVDLGSEMVEGFNKFIPYFLDETLRYTVVLTRSSKRTKISVGSNPWSRPDPLINIATLCQRYGGGGHPVVGAVSMAPTEVQAAREASLEIVESLRSG
jgi:hypothetical protein